MNATVYRIPGFGPATAGLQWKDAAGTTFVRLTHLYLCATIWRKLEDLPVTDQQKPLIPPGPFSVGDDVLYKSYPARIIKLSSDEKRARIKYRQPNNPTETVEWVKIILLSKPAGAPSAEEEPAPEVDQPEAGDQTPTDTLTPDDEAIEPANSTADEEASESDDTPAGVELDDADLVEALIVDHVEAEIRAGNPDYTPAFDPDVELDGFHLGDRVQDADGKPQVVTQIDIANNRILITGHPFYVAPATLTLLPDDEPAPEDDAPAGEDSTDQEADPVDGAPLSDAERGGGVRSDLVPTVGDKVRTFDGRVGIVDRIQQPKSGPEVYYLQGRPDGFMQSELTLVERCGVTSRPSGGAYHPFTGQPIDPVPAPVKVDPRKDRVQIDGVAYNLPIEVRTLVQFVCFNNDMERANKPVDADLAQLRSDGWIVAKEQLIQDSEEDWFRYLRLERTNPNGRTLPAVVAEIAAAPDLPVVDNEDEPVEEPLKVEPAAAAPETPATRLNCLKCRGTGVIRVDHDHSEPCPGCGGTGKVDSLHFDLSRAEGTPPVELSPAGELVALHGAEGAIDSMNAEAGAAFASAFDRAVASAITPPSLLPGALAS